MKNILLCGLIALGASCRASELVEQRMFLVPDINEAKVEQFRRSLHRQVTTVKCTKYAVYGALTLSACEVARRYFFTDNSSAVMQKDHIELATKVEKLKYDKRELLDRVTALENNVINPVNPVEWAPWLYSKAHYAGTKVGSWVPKIAKMWAYSQVAGIVFRHIPTVDGYMGLNPTIDWCMFKGTDFIDSIGGFFNWYKEISLEATPNAGFENGQSCERNVNKKGFSVCSHALVSSIEKVLGYMNFVTESLDAKDPNYLLLKDRSNLVRESIVKHMNELVEMMNAFLIEESIADEVLEGMMNFWHIKIMLIVDQLENFEPVSLAAGFKDGDVKGSFNAVKRFVNPRNEQIKPVAAPTVGPFEQIGVEAVSQVAQMLF